MSTKKATRPNPTTMEGMIWSADHVLGMALSPKLNGLPKSLFKDLVGIAIVTSVQVGFLLSGTTGTGIVMKKTETGWSPPLAVGMSGLGFGILVGASTQELILFIYDDETLQSIASKHGGQLSSQFEVSVGPLGRGAESTLTCGKGGGMGAVFGVAYSKGAFAGLSVEGAKLGAREFVNNKFYSSTTDPKDILYTPGSVTLPPYVGLLDDVYAKLEKLENGETAEPDAAEEAKKQAAKEEADKKAESVKDHPEVVEVDAAAEAAKESSS